MPSRDAQTELLNSAASGGELRKVQFTGSSRSGASRDRTGDLLLAKSTLGVLIVCRTLPLVANTAFSTSRTAHTLPLFAASACALLSPGVSLARWIAAL
jgi:hypothetical protein